MSPHALLPNEPDKVCKAIHAKRGLSVRIAEACDLHRSAVYQWKKVPPHWVATVAEVTGWPPEQIRPDIFKPRNPKAA